MNNEVINEVDLQDSYILNQQKNSLELLRLMVKALQGSDIDTD